MTTGDPLEQLRKEIDSIDDQILALMNKRAEAAIAVAQAKIAAGEGVCFYRPEREANIVRRIREANPGPLDDDIVTRMFRELMSACLALETPLTVAFLGPEGTFTQQAAYKHFGHAVEMFSLPAIDEIFRAVESGGAQFGVVPVENSTEGVIAHTLDRFVDSPLLISGEVVLRIHHNLLSKESAIADVRDVFSHEQSLAQCREWLIRFLPGVRTHGVSSNAEAARVAAGRPRSGAIAGEVAAELYGLRILERNIEDEPNNTTRFLVVSQQAVPCSGADKTSLLVSTENRPGSLYRILEPFARYGISMTKIESRPSRRAMWDYVFFIDIEGHGDEPVVAEALASLKQNAEMFRILGSYPRALP